MIPENVITNSRCIAIYGDVGSGKTALAYSLLNELKNTGKQIYLFKHPCPVILAPLGYKNLTTLEQIDNLKNSIIYIDEPQLHFNIYNKMVNKSLSTLLQMSRQCNITLIISTSDTRVFTKGIESYFDLWLVKQIDYDMVKQGSKIKKIFQDNSLFGNPAGIRLNTNEFFANSSFEEINGKRHTFSIPDHFTEIYSKPYAYYNQSEEFILKKLAEEIAAKTAEESAAKCASQTAGKTAANCAANSAAISAEKSAAKNSLFQKFPAKTAAKSAEESAAVCQFDIDVIKESKESSSEMVMNNENEN